MRTLTILILLFSFSAHGNWAPCSQIDSNSITEVFADGRLVCEQESSDPVGCVEISGKDPRKWKCGYVDDTDRPNRVARDPQACSGLESCQAALASLDCSGYAEGTYALYTAELDQAYCAEPDGTYQQMTALVGDVSGQSMVAGLETEKATKAGKRPARLLKLKNCAQMTPADMTMADLKMCVKALSRDHRRDQLSSGDM